MNRHRKPHSISVGDDLWEQVEHEAASTGQSLSNVVIAALATYFQSRTARHSSWDTDDSDAWYDETKFYTFSQDKFGHSAVITVTIPKMVAGEVVGLIESGRIPELRNAQDFYRNAVRHQAYRTGRMIQDERLIEVSHQMTILDRIATAQAAATEYEELETRTRDLLDEEILLGHYDYVEEELKAYWEAASSVNERFRERWTATLREYQANLDLARKNDQIRGTQRMADGRVFKNGVELATPRRRRSSTE